MNLTQLLAVGKSFIGMRSERSPYELRQENLLPKFGSDREIVAPIPSESALDDSTTRSAFAVSKKPTFRTSFIPKKRNSTMDRPSIQGSLALEEVKVMRNDLLDADLELAPVKNRIETIFPTRIARNTGWSRLGSKLMEMTSVR